jgi:hypothetical protein
MIPGGKVDGGYKHDYKDGEIEMLSLTLETRPAMCFGLFKNLQV